MNCLLDEGLAEATAAALRQLGSDGDRFDHLLELGPAGCTDEELAELCRRHGHDVVITASVRDDDARSVGQEALLRHGLHVLVVRPSRERFDAARQIALLSAHVATVARRCAAATAPTLLHLTASGVAERAG